MSYQAYATIIAEEVEKFIPIYYFVYETQLMENSMNSDFNYSGKESNGERKWISILTTVVLVVVTFSIGVYAGREILPAGSKHFKSDPPESQYVITGDLNGADQDLKQLDFDLFWRVWQQMRAEYVDESKADEKEMFYGAIKGFVNSYGDPATVFLTPEETTEFNKSSAGSYFSGIGAELGYKEGQIVVISPLKGSPAIAAGIRPGDIILAVDGEPIDPNETIYDIVLKIRGEAGTKVALTLLHPGENEATIIEVTRGEIDVPSMEFILSEEDKKIAIFDVSRFTDSTPQEWKNNWDELVEEFQSSGAEGIIIDLRGNPGGYITSAVHAAEEFLDEDLIISKMESRTGSVTEYKVEREGKLLNVPVVVLVNEGSASASEILSGALQKNNRAKVIGKKTYGKGTAQDVVDLPDGSSLHITIMKWLLPDGQWLNPENPISPDTEVELTDEDFKEGVDPQMDKAVEEIQKAI